MATVHNTNKACCSIPPVQSDYQPKGTYKPLGDFSKVYVTGPEKSDNAIICVYDIFGYFPQTQQGADIVAESLCTTVYMPDFFDGKPFDLKKFPPKDEETKAELQAFFGGIASPPETVKKLTGFGQYLKDNGAKKVGTYGFCWGGKVVVVSSGDNTPFSAASIIHPAMLSADDAERLTIPLGIYPSKDEPEEEFNKIVDIIAKKPFAQLNDSKYYKDMFHGWAAARGDLKNEDNRREYDDVYKRLIEFFTRAL